MLKSKFSAFFSLLLVFLSGVLVGGVGVRLYNTSTVLSDRGKGAPPERKGQDPEAVRKQLVDEMRREVKLDDQQVAKLENIYDRTRERFDESKKKWDAEGRTIWDDQTAQIKAMLRSDQVPLFDALRAKHEAEREARKAHRKGPPPPGNPGR
ncbi:MAG TPA: hypothetical protein VLY04_18235 [Bryobacteraceae bacterium]|nr:hypothetical protein [Bryobacteraceae bacterium]